VKRFSTKRCRKIVLGLIAWIAVCGILGIAASMFYCYPVAKAWNASLERHCFDRNTIYYVCAGFNLLNDHILPALPFPFLVKLQIAREDGVVLCSVFSAGLLCVIAPRSLDMLTQTNSDLMIRVTIVSEVRMKALYLNLTDALPHQPSMSFPFLAGVIFFPTAAHPFK
jgi:hypothetical protein